MVSGLSAGGVATYYWVDYVKYHTKTSKVYGMPDSGMFISDYYSPIFKKQYALNRFMNLQKLVGTPTDSVDIPPPVQKCIDKTQNITYCKTSTVYLDYVESPLMIIESPYDQWAIDNIAGARCKTGDFWPYSLENCNATYLSAIEDYRNHILNQIKETKGDRKDVGIWAPSCVQHGFSFDASLVTDMYRIPTGTGQHLYEAI